MCMYKGKEYGSDTGRIINKFDIWICDLGEPVDNNLGKKRPCVIVQSDRFNNPKQNRYIIAPIRTEHSMDVSKDTLQNIVDARREVGRLYVPMEMDPDNFKFIDMTRIQSIPSSDIKIYKTSILSDEVKNNINAALFEVLFSDNEEIEYQKSNLINDNKNLNYELPTEINDLLSKSISSIVDIAIDTIEDCKRTVRQVKQREGIEAAKKAGKHLGRPRMVLPDTFPDVYNRWVNGEITAKDAYTELGVASTSFYKMAKRYEEDNNIERNIKKPVSNTKVKLQKQTYSFDDAYKLIVTNQLSIDDASPMFDMSKTDFIKYIDDHEKKEVYDFNKFQNKVNKQKNRSKVLIPKEFVRTYIQWEAKIINASEAAIQLNMNPNQFIILSNNYKRYKERV